MPAGYSIRDMARDQAAVLRRLEIKKATVMGVSQGGMIAQYMAIDHPDLVKKLVIAVSAPCANEETRNCIQNWIEMIERKDYRRLFADTAEKSYSEKYLKKIRKLLPLLAQFGKPKDDRRFLISACAILSFDTSEEIEKITCPTLILGGEADKIVGIRASHILHEKIPGSELYVYPELGHAVYEEAPDFNDRVFAFLEAEG